MDWPSPFPLLFLLVEGFLSPSSDLSPFLESFFAGLPSNYSFKASYSFYLSASSLAHLSLLEATDTLASFSLSIESTMLSSYLQSLGS